MAHKHRAFKVFLSGKFLNHTGVTLDSPHIRWFLRTAEAWEIDVIYRMGLRGGGGNRPDGRMVAAPAMHQNQRTALSGHFHPDRKAIQLYILFHYIFLHWLSAP